MPKFPHLDGAPRAYGPGREVYEQIPGEFDYTRWNDAMAHVHLISVPWCGDYDNVVDFGSEAARDEWLDAQDGYSADTLYRRAPAGTFNVEIPYTSALWYNYLVVDLPEETSAERPLPGVDPSQRVGRLCYFVNDCRPVSGSTTELSISLDVWTTFINRVSVDYMMLAQGHAPMAETTVAEYLTNPAANAEHLTTPDVGVDAGYVRSVSHVDYNSGPAYMCIATTADWTNLPGQYGTVRALPLRDIQGLGAPRVWALALSGSNYIDFVNALMINDPALIDTIQAVFLIQQDLVTLSSTSITYQGFTLTQVTAGQQSKTLLDLSASDFNYDSKYANIAKLYTSPYAHIEVTNARGNVMRINVEDTSGTISVRSMASLAFPYLAIDCQLEGIGQGAGSITIQGLSSKSYGYAGNFYQYFSRFDIPTFSVYQSAYVTYDWSNHYTNQQRQTAASNALASAQATNATSVTNAGNSASNVTANNATTVAASSEIATRNAGAAADGYGYSSNKMYNDRLADVSAMYAGLQAEQATLAVAATNNDAQAATNGVTNLISGIAGTVGSALSGDIGGAIGTAAGAISNAVNQGVAWSAANSSITVSQSNSEALYSANVAAAASKYTSAITFNANSTALQNDTNTANTTTQNTASTTIASRNAALINTNAGNSAATGNANAQREYNTATSAITNDTAQAALGAPHSGGAYTGSTEATTKPMSLFAAVVTANPADIARAGDQMLRYGYACDFAWHVTDWVPCEKFCYWRAEDLWLAGSGNVSETYQRSLRDILMNGTTVWKDPAEIGKVSIYDNGF